jgi:hypothetical protein
MGFCLKSEVGGAYEQGTRPAAPVYWTQGAYSRGECLLEEIGTRIDAPGPAPADENQLAGFVDPSLLTTDEQRQFQLTQLYKAVHILQPAIEVGDRMAMESMVKLQTRIASISGLDQPRIREAPRGRDLRDIQRLSDDELMEIAAEGVVYRNVVTPPAL